MFRCKQMFTSYYNILHGIVLKNILLTLQLTQCVSNSPFEKATNNENCEVTSVRCQMSYLYL
jgi:hypothetical protein